MPHHILVLPTNTAKRGWKIFCCCARESFSVRAWESEQVFLPEPVSFSLLIRSVLNWAHSHPNSSLSVEILESFFLLSRLFPSDIIAFKITETGRKIARTSVNRMWRNSSSKQRHTALVTRRNIKKKERIKLGIYFGWKRDKSLKTLDKAKIDFSRCFSVLRLAFSEEKKESISALTRRRDSSTECCVPFNHN